MEGQHYLTEALYCRTIVQYSIIIELRNDESNYIYIYARMNLIINGLI